MSKFHLYYIMYIHTCSSYFVPHQTDHLELEKNKCSESSDTMKSLLLKRYINAFGMLFDLSDSRTRTNCCINVYMIYLCPYAVVFQLAQT